jgi:hypothetical protein
MRTKIGYENVDIEKFDDHSWNEVSECRQLVGYQEDAAWECPYLLEGESFREQFGDKSKDVGGLICYPCLVKETYKWVSAGLPIPITAGAIGGISTHPTPPSET